MGEGCGWIPLCCQVLPHTTYGCHVSGTICLATNMRDSCWELHHAPGPVLTLTCSACKFCVCHFLKAEHM